MRHSKPPKVTGQRPLKVAEEIKRILAQYFIRDASFHENNLPISLSMIHLTEVKCSPDLRNATVFFRFLIDLPSELSIKECEKEMNTLVPEARHEIAQKLTIKFVPDLCFRWDSSVENAARINRIIGSLPKNPDSEEEEE